MTPTGSSSDGFGFGSGSGPVRGGRRTGRRRDARFITIISPHAVEATLVGEALTVAVPGGQRVLHLAPEGLRWE